jgi:hypothetical protein
MTTDSPPVLRSRLLAEGYSDDEIRRMLRGRQLVGLRPGAYLEPGDERLDRPETRHGALVRATIEQLGPDSVVGYASAAVLHGLDPWAVPLGQVHLVRDGAGGGRRTRYLHLHRERLVAEQVVLVDGIAVTSVPDTVCALARTVPFEQAVAVADSALHRRMTSPAELAAAVERAAGRPGVAAAARVVAFADGRAESVGESRSRVAIARAGLPVPVLQFPLHALDGRYLGRADFGWPERRTVGEFDGLIKYGRLTASGRSAADVVVDEKLREDAVRDTGTRFTRWIWADLAPFDAVAARLRHLLEP